MSHYLPGEIVEDILVRVPVKYLLKLKCVCKNWYALIGDNNVFKKKHYQFQYDKHVADHNDVPLLLNKSSPNMERWNKTYYGSGQFYILSRNRNQDENVILSSIIPDFERDVPPRLSNDFVRQNMYIRCMGVANGVIGLSWTYRSCINRTALWNPATREFKELARWRPNEERYKSFSPGREIISLGFHVQSNDFKILGTLCYCDNHNHRDRLIDDECDMYSLKTNSWKRIGNCPHGIFTAGVDADCLNNNNGVHYWLRVRDLYTTTGVSFDFSTEVFNEFDLPKDNGDECRCDDGEDMTKYDENWLMISRVFQRLGKYNEERLALFVTRNSKEEVCSRIDIWVVDTFRDDYREVPLTWQLLFTVGPIQTFINGILHFHRFRICGDMVFCIMGGGITRDASMIPPHALETT